MGLFNKDNKTEDKVIDIPVEKPAAKTSARRIFLVDYENVSDAGLVGVNTLTPTDTVIIFYGSNIKSVAYNSLIAITSSRANIEHLKAEKTAKNYLDFQLSTYLGYKLGKEAFDEIYIISKDSGFDAVVDFWSTSGYKIERRVAIAPPEKPANSTTKKKANTTSNKKNAVATPAKPSISEKQRSELRAALKDAGLSAPDYKKIYDAFVNSDTTMAYNNKLQKTFGNTKTSEIYQRTVKIFEKEHKA